MKTKWVRRDFFRFAGGGVLGTAASGISLRDVSLINAELTTDEIEVPDGPESWALSVCTLCPGACGVRVRKIGDRAVKIQGNPLHPVNGAGMCPRGLAGLQQLYHPDRLTTPLKNVGTRRSPRWQEISWEEAVSVLGGQLKQLKQKGEPHAAALVDRSQRSLRGSLLRRFMTAFGSPNYLVMPSGLDALQTAAFFQQGLTEPLVFDFEHTRSVLSFGVDSLEGWGSPAALMRSFGGWRDSAVGERARFVQIEPRLSVTAARADEWVSVKPGMEATLALGIAYGLITEGLYDTYFVSEHTFGFDDWSDSTGKSHMGFRTLVLSEYRLNDVSQATGVQSETILRLARQFGRNRPALALGDFQTSTLSGDPYAAMAVHSLNALVGSVNTAGGVMSQAETPFFSNAPAKANRESPPRLDAQPDQPYPGPALWRLPQTILSGKPYRLQVLLLNEVNPLYSMPNGEAFRKVFDEVPFIASFAPFPDESSAAADLVLPAPTGLERWQDAGSPPGFPYVTQSISPPVVESRHNTRDAADIVLEIARSLGGSTAEALPFADFEQYLRQQAAEIFAAHTGSVFATQLEDTWYKLMERSGWWAPTYASEKELWEQMTERGGWWEPALYYGGSYATPSKRFEFFSQTLAGWAKQQPGFAAKAGLAEDDDRLFLPHQPKLEEPTEDYPLLLLPVEVLALSGGEGGHLPYLQQIAGSHMFSPWDSWLEIHPETAHRLGISDEETVWLESRRGRAQVRAKLYEGAPPNVVCLPLGYGHTEGSAWGRQGLNPLDFLEEYYEPLAGLPQVGRTYVRIYQT